MGEKLANENGNQGQKQEGNEDFQRFVFHFFTFYL
jgi:hypothetical protein